MEWLWRIFRSLQFEVLQIFKLTLHHFILRGIMQEAQGNVKLFILLEIYDRDLVWHDIAMHNTWRWILFYDDAFGQIWVLLFWEVWVVCRQSRSSQRCRISTVGSLASTSRKIAEARLFFTLLVRQNIHFEGTRLFLIIEKSCNM